MILEEIPLFCVLPEVEKSVTDLLLSHSDSAEFLGSDIYGLKSIYDLYGTDYEDIVPAYVSDRTGDSWGLYGKIYKFRLSDELISHIRKEGLTCMFRVDNSCILENLTLFNGDSIVFSCLSHEVFSLYGYGSIDDGLKEEVLLCAHQAIESTRVYADMKKIYENLSKKTPSDTEKEISILFQLYRYVDQAKGVWFYQKPTYECDYKKFCKIAKKYLTEDLIAHLLKFKKFADLQPLPVAHTSEDIGARVEMHQYINSDFYKALSKELDVLKYIKK